MKIILLEGNKRAGKTPTLQMVYAVLKLLNATIINPPSHIPPIKRDFEAVLSFQNKKVAIFTKGDVQAECKKAITKYANKKVDVLILAHSSNLPQLNTAPHPTVIIQKTVPPNNFEEMSSHIGDCKLIITHI